MKYIASISFGFLLLLKKYNSQKKLEKMHKKC